jgi:ubiquinone/menaquinone biosynthesis C-methylase UbiE
VKGAPAPDHYSYRHYEKAATASTFDDRRFGGPIGNLVSGTQAQVLASFIGRIDERRILDVGTGTGRAARLLASGGAQVTAVDASEAMLAVAREKAAADGVRVQFQRGDAHALEFRDRSFDVTVCLRLLMHTPEWRQCIAELCRVSQRLVIVDYPSSSSFALLESVTRRALHGVGVGAEPYRVFSDAMIAEAFDQHGFRIRSMHRQFVIPIAFHKAIGSRRFTLGIESMLERVGLLKRLGSPVSIVAERCAFS